MGPFRRISKAIDDLMLSNNSVKQACSDLFLVADRDSDGRVSIEEAAGVCTPLFERVEDTLKDHGLNIAVMGPDDVKRIASMCDVDGNGQIDEAEFKRLYCEVMKQACLSAAKGFGMQYGAAMAGGVASLWLMKRVIPAVPVVGLVASPVLAFVPTLLVGAAGGFAFAYGKQRGDILYVPKKLKAMLTKHGAQYKSG